MTWSEYRDREKKTRNTQDSKQMLYDYDWQVLRINLDFTTFESTKSALTKIKKYVNEKDLNKVMRALNLLAATRMGFSGQRKTIKDSDKRKDLAKRDEIVLEYLDRLSKINKELKETGKKPEPLNEEDQIKDLKNADLKNFTLLYNDLIYRYENSSRSNSRPELKDYLKLMHKVLESKGKEFKDHVNESLDNLKNKSGTPLRKEKRDKVKEWKA